MEAEANIALQMTSPTTAGQPQHHRSNIGGIGNEDGGMTAGCKLAQCVWDVDSSRRSRLVHIRRVRSTLGTRTSEVSLPLWDGCSQDVPRLNTETIVQLSPVTTLCS